MRASSGLAVALAVSLLNKNKRVATQPLSPAEIECSAKAKERAEWNAEVERKKAQRAQAQKQGSE